MEQTEQTEARAGAAPRVDHRAPAAERFAQQGEPSPLAAIERVLRRPLSLGIALLLVVGNVLGWAWSVHRADERFDRLAEQVSDAGAQGAAFPEADPDLCWLVGAQARAAGRGPAFVGATGIEPQVTACQEAAVRGAQGEPR